MKNKSYFNILENIYLNIEKIDENFILMKEQLCEFKDGDKIKINFKECHVAICPNGGLIAICKKKGFLDISKGSKINNNIIIMNQKSKRKLYISIDWNYRVRWIVTFEFNEKEQLYAICNDGSIYKINILNVKAEPKVSSELFKNEEIEKCKLYKNGFIALTVDGNIYHIPNIKNPIPELFVPIKSLLDFSNNIEYLIIPEETSRSRKLELLITNDKGPGVIQVIKSEEGKLGIMPVDIDSNKIAYKNINIIRNTTIETFVLDDNEKKDNKNDKNKPKEDDMGKILTMAISPLHQKIALYNDKGHVILFDAAMNYLDKTLFQIKGDFTDKEKNELKTIINFKDGYQLLFCCENIIALSGQRFILFINLESYNQFIYKIIEGYEMQAIQGALFSKCISEIDGIRYMTNEGVFLISEVNKELYDICDTFSNSNNKKLMKYYLNNLNDISNNEVSMRELKNNLSKVINNLLIAASNIFWVYDDKLDVNDKINQPSNFDIYNKEKKEVQLFILESAQYGKSFVKSDSFNFDKFLQFCKDIRIINNLRNHPTRPKLITFNEYKNMDFNDLINKLMRNLNFGIAIEICHFLDYDDDFIYKKFCAYHIKSQRNNYSISDELKLFDIIQTKLSKSKKLPYLELAKKSFKYGKTTLGLKFLENEKLKIAKIPQYMELKEWETALKLGEKIYNSDIMLTILDTLYKKEGADKFLSIVSNHPKIKDQVIKYLSFNKETASEEIEDYLNIVKNPEELFFYYLEEYFQSDNISERKQLISLAKENEKLITNAINPNFEHKFYKNYLDNLSNDINFKNEIMKLDLEKKDKPFIRNPDELSFDISLYDTYKLGVKGEVYDWVEHQNKKFNFSHEGMTIMRCLSYCEMNKIIAVDALVKRYSNIKKIGLNYLNLSEIFFKFKDYKRAEENIKLINDSFYLGYKIDMLKYMDKYETALDIIVADKNNINRKDLINDILLRKPELKVKVDELFNN